VNLLVTNTNQVIEENCLGTAKGGYKPGIKEEGAKHFSLTWLEDVGNSLLKNTNA